MSSSVPGLVQRRRTCGYPDHAEAVVGIRTVEVRQWKEVMDGDRDGCRV